VEAPLRGPLVPAALRQNSGHMAVLINRPPEITALSLDSQTHLIRMPLVTGPRAATQLRGVGLSEFAAPFADGFIGEWALVLCRG
jgi:hypothetical protein